MNSLRNWKVFVEEHYTQVATMWGILGGSCSGKSRILKELSDEQVLREGSIAFLPKNSWNGIDGDRYYFSRQRNIDHGVSIDHPDSWNWDLLRKDLIAIQNGNTLSTMPRYQIINDMGVSRMSEDRYQPAQHNCLAGIHTYDKRIADLLTGYVYLYVPLHVLYLRRILRDGYGKTGQTPANVQKQFMNDVFPAMEKYMWPSVSQIVTDGACTVIPHYQEDEAYVLQEKIEHQTSEECFLTQLNDDISFLKSVEKNYLF